MYFAILRTHYEIYATGRTSEEVKAHIVTGYKNTYPAENREFINPTFEQLNDFYGCPIIKIDPRKGYTHE